MFPLRSKHLLTDFVRIFLLRVNNRYSAEGNPVQVLRANNSPEDVSKKLTTFCNSLGILSKTSPAYAPESNGLADRLFQEHWMRARVILMDNNLRDNL